MDQTMQQSDHDLLIRLEAQLEAHSVREHEVSRQTLDKLSELAASFGQLKDNFFEQRRDVHDLQKLRADDDLRIASLEAKVDALQDAAQAAKAVADAGAKAAEARTKRYALITGSITFLIGAGPTIIGWINHLFNAGVTP